MQITAQDYRDRFLNDHLPLTQIAVHRSVTQTFAKRATEFRLDLTARNTLDYLMFNASADKRSSNRTFGETSPIEDKTIAHYLDKKIGTIQNTIVTLVKADLIERHRVKRNVYIIPSMIKAKAELAEQAVMKREMNITKKAEARLAGLEAEGLTITADIRRRVYAEETQKYQPSNGKHHHNGNGSTPELPFG